MADVYTSSLRIVQETIGSNENSWGTLNNSALAMLDEAIAGQVSVSVTAGDVTLSTANNATDQSRPTLLILTGTPGTTRNVTFPDVKKVTHVFNNTSDGSSVVVKSGAGTTVTVYSGEKVTVYSDGATNVALLRPAYKEGTFTPVLTFGGASVGVTYSQQAGAYTKIGNRVFVDITIALTSKGSSTGSAKIEGLPFAANGSSPFASLPMAVIRVDLNTAGGIYNAWASPSGTAVVLKTMGDNVGAADLDDTNITNTTFLYVSMSYRI
jgi:hypothetical protein